MVSAASLALNQSKSNGIKEALSYPEMCWPTTERTQQQLARLCACNTERERERKRDVPVSTNGWLQLVRGRRNFSSLLQQRLCARAPLGLALWQAKPSVVILYCICRFWSMLSWCAPPAQRETRATMLRQTSQNPEQTAVELFHVPAAFAPP